MPKASRTVKRGSPRPKSKSKEVKKPLVKHANLPSSLKIFQKSNVLIKNNWAIFLCLTLTYGFLYLLLVRGFSGGINISSLRSSLEGSKGSTNLSISFKLLADLVGNSSSSQSSSTSGIYQAILIIIFSLAVIWTLRQLYSGKKHQVRESFYKGMYPLIPFIGILLILILEFIPLLIGASLYSQVMTNGIAIGALEKIIWFMVFISLSFLSLYMATSTIFALYIVTLPDMTPLKAIRSARELLRKRRFLVLRKILFLPLIIFIGFIVVMLPVIILIAPIASWVFLLIGISLIVIIHSYCYALYRELINE